MHEKGFGRDTKIGKGKGRIAATHAVTILALPKRGALTMPRLFFAFDKLFTAQPKVIMAGIQPILTMPGFRKLLVTLPLPVILFLITNIIIILSHHKHYHKSRSDDPGAADYVNSRPLLRVDRPNIYSGGTI